MQVYQVVGLGGSIGGGSNEYFGSLGRVLQHLRSCQPPTSLVQSSCSGLYRPFRVEDPRKGLEWLLVFFLSGLLTAVIVLNPPPRNPSAIIQADIPICGFRAFRDHIEVCGPPHPTTTA